MFLSATGHERACSLMYHIDRCKNSYSRFNCLHESNNISRYVLHWKIQCKSWLVLIKVKVPVTRLFVSVTIWKVDGEEYYNIIKINYANNI